MRPYITGKYQLVLDAGGWRNPHPEATHVVDVLPWETRRLKHNVEPLRNERFTRDTWFQVNFLDSELRLPFSDKYFDYAICSHTLEDLVNPTMIIRELQRVAKAGYIEVPSRITEQTVGIRDRACRTVGHPHHQWIVDTADDSLLFYRKHLSHNEVTPKNSIPLRLSEKLRRTRPEQFPNNLAFPWEDAIPFKLIEDNALCCRRSEELVESINPSRSDYTLDAIVRFGRRTRDMLRRKQDDDLMDWLRSVELSRRYSSIKLPF